MNRIKCECGHINPEGTVLCEACGKPIEGNQHIDGNDKKLLLNMRYEGSARRSQTFRRSLIDKVWSFFSSVKVGVWLIVIALVASMIGTIFPQQQFIPPNAESRDPAVYYESQFGLIGKIYYELGFYQMYNSWWYLLLLGMIGVSLVICSLDRFIPLYKALKVQKPKRHEIFLNRQRFYSETNEVSKEEIEQVKERLKRQRYKISEQNGHILAEKGRFSRWGPYVNHIGLIIILLSAILRTTPLMFTDEYVWVREGETIVIPGTKSEYYVENEQFLFEVHDPEDERFRDAIEQEGMVPSNFQTDAIIYKATNSDVVGAEPDLEPVLNYSINMNNPAKFDGYTLYQSGYQQNEFSNMTFKIHETNDESATAIDSFTINLFGPASEYTLDSGFRVVIDQYYPDYYLDDSGIPTSETNYPRNPAFVLQVYPPESPPEVSFIGIGRNIDATGENDYKVAIEDFETHYASGLTLRVDRTLIFFGIGAAIFMIGVVQGMYWQHRRIWIHPKYHGVLLAAHTNKNWFGLSNDIAKAIEQTNIKMVVDRQELDE